MTAVLKPQYRNSMRMGGGGSRAGVGKVRPEEKIFQFNQIMFHILLSFTVLGFSELWPKEL